MTEGPEKTLVFRLNENGVGPELIREVFLEKGWSEFTEDTQEKFDWNLWWRTSRFRSCDYDQLHPWQRLNHYPKTIAITKKDSLARNLKRMRGVYGSSVYNFSPLAFNLPNEYTRFVAEYTKQREKSPKDQYWICKPADLSRGRGIFIIKDLSELQYDCNAVLQRYITKPLLISGYKFDLRIYVMVPSFHPLQIYIYEEGLVRFSTEKYDLSSLRNMFSHLTNTSINKYSPGYLLDKERVGPGCKWTLTQLRHYLRQSNIDDSLLWGRIINIIILTVLIQASDVPKATNCFELYGFDVMIDDNLKPWLLEVNFSPALSSDCHTDIVVKKPLLHDVIDMLGLGEVDKDRGGADSRQRQIHQAYGVHRSSSSTSRKPRARDQLPHIVQQQSVAAPTYDTDSESEAPVLLVPGCGLPSVQQSQSRRPHSSSVCSSGSSDEEMCLSQHSSLNSKLGHSVPGSGSMQHYTGAHKQYNCSPYQAGIYERRPLAAGSVHGKHPLYKRDSRVSVQSDSGVSSYSGSSDNSDTSTRNRRNQRWTYDPARRKLSSVQNSSNRNNAAREKPQENGSRNQHPLLRQTSKSSAPTQSASGPSRTKDTSMGHLRHRNSLPTHPGHDTITRKSAVLRSTQNTRSMKLTSRSKQATAKPTDRHSSRSKSLPTRVGDFVLVFPFSEATRKCTLNSHSTAVMRTVINECQSMLRERGRAMGGQGSQVKETSHAEIKSVPWLWVPQRDPAGTVH